MTWREVLPGPFRPTHGFELSWSMLKTWPVRAEALLEPGVPSLEPHKVGCSRGWSCLAPPPSDALRAPQYVAPPELCFPFPPKYAQGPSFPTFPVADIPNPVPPPHPSAPEQYLFQYCATPTHTVLCHTIHIFT